MFTYSRSIRRNAENAVVRDVISSCDISGVPSSSRHIGADVPVHVVAGDIAAAAVAVALALLGRADALLEAYDACSAAMAGAAAAAADGRGAADVGLSAERVHVLLDYAAWKMGLDGDLFLDGSGAGAGAGIPSEGMGMEMGMELQGLNACEREFKEWIASIRFGGAGMEGDGGTWADAEIKMGKVMRRLARVCEG